jgi:transketolase
VRTAFINTLCNLAEVDDRILLLTGDLGYMAMEPFQERFASRFFNAGVAEQNMIGLASGLAEAGMRPYAYSIATFAALRPFEFIRNGPVMHGLPVRVVGMGAGFEYGTAGPTHHALEDIGVMRTLPGLTIVIPADSQQAAEAIQNTSALPGPVYYSLGKDDRVKINGLDGRFELGRMQLVREGADIAIIAMGSISAEAVAAAEELAGEGIQAAVAVVSNFHPDPEEDVARLLENIPHVVTVEAQTLSGGLAAFVATVIASRGIACRLSALGVRTQPDGTSGPQAERQRKHGLDRMHIAQTARKALGGGGDC